MSTEQGKRIKFYDELKGFWCEGVIVKELEDKVCVDIGTGVLHWIPKETL
jgi:hypothetical protein